MVRDEDEELPLPCLGLAAVRLPARPAVLVAHLFLGAAGLLGLHQLRAGQVLCTTISLKFYQNQFAKNIKNTEFGKAPAGLCDLAVAGSVAPGLEVAPVRLLAPGGRSQTAGCRHED